MESKKLTQSKTVWFNMVMAGLESAHGALHLVQPMMTPDQFALISLVLGIIHGMGGVYLRMITNASIE